MGKLGFSCSPVYWKKSVNGEFLFGKGSSGSTEAAEGAGGRILPLRPQGCSDQIPGRCLSLSCSNGERRWSCFSIRMLKQTHNLVSDLLSVRKRRGESLKWLTFVTNITPSASVRFRMEGMGSATYSHVYKMHGNIRQNVNACKWEGKLWNTNQTYTDFHILFRRGE